MVAGWFVSIGAWGDGRGEYVGKWQGGCGDRGKIVVNRQKQVVVWLVASGCNVGVTDGAGYSRGWGTEKNTSRMVGMRRNGVGRWDMWSGHEQLF